MAGGEAKEIFLEALERRDESREAYLAGACGEDPALLGRVRRLVQAHARAESFLSASAAGALAAGPAAAYQDELDPGAEIGPYRLAREIGQGGFGVVWLAEQLAPIRRHVALKVLKAGLDTREVVARFEAERQALALMDHPGIARVYDGGATERGRPWFAMELVDGVPITSYCERRDLGTDERLRLFADVCRAVQHAHQKGVIHRDLKPSNVLVAEVDGRPQPKVIDFGIAKAVDRRLTEETFLTRDGQVVGTPAYMSPEQIDDRSDVDTRADVYALGVMLYELLSGTTPFGDTTARTAGFAEVARMIREVDPPKPSTRLRRGGTRSTSVTSRRVRGDLDWIVMRCLEKDRERRYDSASVLANEVDRHLRGEPVLAGPPGLRYRMGKLARRHAGALGFAAALFLVLALGVVEATRQAHRARAAELRAAEDARRARVELERSREIAAFMEHLLLSLDPAYARGRDPALLLEVLQNAVSDLESRQLVPEVEASLRRIVGGAYFELARAEQAAAHLGRALELREAALGPEHLATLQSLDELGGALVLAGRAAEAEPLLRRAWEGRLRTLGPRHEDTLLSLSNLAFALHRLRRLDEAERLLRELEEVRLEELGERDERTILAISNLAAVLEDQGELAEAHERYARALDLGVEVAGEDAPDTLKAMTNLASTAEQLGDLEQAEDLLRGALEIKERVLPEGHPSTLVGMSNLAQLCADTGRLDEAEELYLGALALVREHVAPGDPVLPHLLHNYAQTLLRQARWAEAEPLLEEATRLLPEDPEAGGPLATSTAAALARVRLELGD